MKKGNYYELESIEEVNFKRVTGTLDAYEKIFKSIDHQENIIRISYKGKKILTIRTSEVSSVLFNPKMTSKL